MQPTHALSLDRFKFAPQLHIRSTRVDLRPSLTPHGTCLPVLLLLYLCLRADIQTLVHSPLRPPYPLPGVLFPECRPIKTIS